MPAQPDLSIVTVSFNTRDMLRDTLGAVQRNHGELVIEHWVVDNASTDGTVEMIKREYPGVGLVVNRGNLGAGPARNLVIPSCKGRYILSLDSDVIVNPDTMRGLVDYMEQHADVGAAGCKLLNSDGTYQRSARHLQQIGPAIRRRIRAVLGGSPSDFSAATSAVNVGWLVGAICIYRKAALEKVGLFDPQFFIYRDDLDLHTRLHRKGWKVAYLPSISVTHFFARTADHNYAVATFDLEYGDLLFTRKYGPRWWYWNRRGWLLLRSFYFSRLCPDKKLRKRFWGKNPTVMRRVYRGLLRASLPVPGRRLAASSAPPAGVDWTGT